MTSEYTIKDALLASFVGVCALAIGFGAGYHVRDSSSKEERELAVKSAQVEVYKTIESDLERKAGSYFFIAAKEAGFKSLDVPVPGSNNYSAFVEKVSNSTNNYAKNTLLFGEAYSIYANEVKGMTNTIPEQ